MRFLMIFCFTCQLLWAAPAQIIVLRHAEKDPVTAQLVKPEGLERAAALAYYLTETPYLQNFGPIAAVFAARQINQSDRIVPRPIETMMPVAELLQLPVHSPFNATQTDEMADFILNSPQYDGKNIVICWNHTSMIALLNSFGYQWPLETTFYPNCRFDMVFVLTYPQTSPYPLLYFQQLLYGDATCPSCGPNQPCHYPCPNQPCPNSGCIDPPNTPQGNQTCPSYTPPPTCLPCGP